MIYDPEVQSLSQLVSKQAQLHAARPALTCAATTLSYAELAERVYGSAQQLQAWGVTKHDRVALLARDGIEYVTLLLAIACLGAVVVPLNWRLNAEDIQYILEHSDSRVLLRGAEFAALGSPSGNVRVVELESLEWSRAPHLERAAAVAPQDPVVQMYTSGTTGRPKGVVLSHESFFAIAREFHARQTRWIGWSASDVSLCAVPLFHIGGLWWLVRGLASGAHNVMLPQFVGWQAAEAIRRYQVTKAALVPAMIRVMLAEPDSTPQCFASLQTMVYGGSPCAPALLRHAMDVMRCDMVQIYGLTETGNMAVCLPAEQHDNEQRLLAAGKALPGVELKIIDAQGREVPQGKVGEVCIRSPAVMLEYWKNPSATSETLRDGWLHTGDGGYLDEEGYLFISDRIKDMICCAGENIYPAEIENVLAGHPAISEVSVIGVPDANWGEAVKALVVARPGQDLTFDELRRFCSTRLADFKVPRSMDLVSELPRTASGKVRKQELRSRYWSGQERNVG